MGDYNDPQTRKTVTNQQGMSIKDYTCKSHLITHVTNTLFTFVTNGFYYERQNPCLFTE